MHPPRLQKLIDAIRPVDPGWAKATAARWDSLTKPPGSLGRIEEIGIRLGAIQGTDRPDVSRKRVYVMAGDHGVTQRGVSPYPSEVTGQMVANFASGGAAINQIAGWCGAQVVVIDVGVLVDVSDIPGVLDRKVARGTADMSSGPAMTPEQASSALMVGVEAASTAAAEGIDLVSTGEMGIGNTTAASAIVCALTGAEPSEVVGPGTGLDAEGVSRKVQVVTEALAVNAERSGDPLAVLASLGGLEIVALAGLVLGCAAEGLPVVTDGFISGAATLAASRIAPLCAEYVFPSHLSAEPGHAAVMEALDLEPLLSLGMRLGEGTGAALVMGLMQASCDVIGGMATFEEAGIASEG